MRGVSGFEPDRLREALHLRKRTAKDVAAAVKIAENSLSKYVTGTNIPQPHTLLRLANELDLPESYFLRPTSALDGSPVFYRSMAAATKRARNSALVRHRWLREAWGYLQEYVEFPPVTLPEFDLPSDPTEISNAQIEEVAQQTRAHWGLGGGPIANVVSLLEHHGCIVARVNLGSPKLDAFSQWAEPEGRPFITLNTDKRSAVRSRWDASHELAHMLLHRHVETSLLRTPEVFKEAERQAHRFAGAFLLPAESFSRSVYVPAISALVAQKRVWKVSIAAMLTRMHQLHLISHSHVTRVWQSYSRQGMRRWEPLDDEIQLEQPEVLRHSVELLMQTRGVTREQLLTVLPFDATELQAILGLPLKFNRPLAPVVRMKTASREDKLGTAHGEAKVLPFRPPTSRVLKQS